jgi:hypothetical protein
MYYSKMGAADDTRQTELWLSPEPSSTVTLQNE